MSNPYPEDLALLLQEIKQGKKPLSARPMDMRGAQLAGEDLSGLDLSAVDLSGADLSGAKLTGAKLTGTKLFKTKLVGAKLVKCNLRHAELSAADLTDANLMEVDARKAGLGRACLRRSHLFQANLEGATLTQADLRQADLRCTTLCNTRMREADLRQADFTEADMRGIDLALSEISNATLNNANLQDARLRLVSGYKKASWFGVDIRDINFAGAYRIRRFIIDQNYLKEYRESSRLSGFLYYFWWASSDCGRSMSRWCFLILVQVLLFAWLFTKVPMDYGPHQTWLSPLYFSVVTLTTLGYGDVVPASLAGQSIAIIEVITGYLMLGGLISIFSNVIARRAE